MLQRQFPSGLLTLDDDHVYRLDGKVIPGNTEILKRAEIIDDRYYNIEATLRGTAVHELTSLYCEYDGDFHWPSVDSRYVGYCRGWEAFKRETGFKTLLNEYLVLGDGYGTVVDRVGILNGRVVIVEIKTGARPKWGGLQTEMQRQALVRHPVEGALPVARYCVELKKDGGYKLTELTDSADAADVQALVKAWHVRAKYRK